MKNENNNEFQLIEENVFNAGEEASTSDGKKISADDFRFVQQDEHIHDVKFTTKPTTFFKDAMRRFSKNHSSVVGGIILGFLFILSIILPIEGVLPFNVDIQSADATNLNYETNLPAKLFEAGTGFWDGTRTLNDQPYIYETDASGNDVLDENGERIYLDSNPYSIDAIVNPEQIEPITGRLDVLNDYSDGGFYYFYHNPNSSVDSSNPVVGGYVYSYAYNYDLSYDFTLTYTLGWRDQENFVMPQYDILFYDGEQFFPLTNFTGFDMGEQGELYDENSTVYPYSTITVNLNELLLNCSALVEKYGEDFTSISGSFGFTFADDSTYYTAIYIRDFILTASSSEGEVPASVEREMTARSFVSDPTNTTFNYNVCDVLRQPRINSSTQRPNNRYWASNGATGTRPADALNLVCTITYDMYKITYGYRTDLSAIASSVFQSWIDQGYIEYTFGDPSSYRVLGDYEDLDEYIASGETPVYVKSVTGENVDGNTVTLNCEILAWKYFGYTSMPSHLLGTDGRGRDLLKYSFEGLRNSLLIGIVVAAINIIIGVVWGSISGYFGGKVDLVLERLVDILAGVPWIVLMTILCIKIGQTPFVFGLALCLTGWIGTEAVTRSQFYRYKGREYVLASRTLGARSPRLIFRHILPNALGTIVTSSVLMIPSVIFNEATISYLGLGFSNLGSLGVILSENQSVLATYPYRLVVPAVLIALLMICFNLFGNGLRDAFNPSLKGTD